MKMNTQTNTQQGFASFAGGFKRSLGLAIGGAVLFGTVFESQAVLLNATTTFATTPTAVVQPGAIVAGGNMTALYGPSIGGADQFYGALQSIVVRRSGAALIDGQNFVANGLDFWVQLRLDVTAPAPISNPTADNSRLTYSPFLSTLGGPGNIISAEFLTGAVVPAGVPGFSTLPNGTQTPFTVQDSNAGVIGWDWTSVGADNSLVAATPNSRWLVLHTNDTQFGVIGASVQDGGVAPTQTFAPVPEPTSALFGVAMTSLLGLVRRKRN